MNDKRAQLQQAELEDRQIAEELAEAEAKAYKRICKLKSCAIKFATDDGRRHYCCTEHYLVENRKRTKARNAARKTIDT